MENFDYKRPATLAEALGLLKEFGSDAAVLAGGTDVIVQLREGRRSARLVIDIKNIPEVNILSCSPAEGLTLGAAVPCYRITSNPEICDAYPGLIDAFHIIGGTQIQGRASIGGNLCNASPAADSIPALIAHGAACNIAGPEGERQVPAAEFCTGPGQTTLNKGEILVSIQAPAPPAHFGAHYQRFIPRFEMDIAVVGAGAAVVLNEAGDSFESVRVGLGAVGPTPLYVSAVGEALNGQSVSEAAIEKAGQLAREAATPITDMRGSASQRKHLADVLTRRTLETAIQRARNGNRP